MNRLAHLPDRGLLLLALLLLPGVVSARQGDHEAPTPTRGVLLLRSTDASAPPAEAPQLLTEVSMRVTGMVARVEVRQRFRNPGREWREGSYVFPLPETAAVDRMRLVIGERVVEGQVRERAEARRSYTAARDSGRRASLVEQERPNIFTTSVANIGPGEEVSVEIAYQQAVDYRDGEFGLRFPLVVGPRYIPGVPTSPVEERLTVSHGWAVATDQVPDAERITPPVRAPGEVGENPVTITVELQPGAPLDAIVSPHHAVIEERSGTRYRLRLAEGPVPADRDFELRWTLVPAQAPRAALFAEARGDRHYTMLMLLPPERLAAEQAQPPRDLVLVIDVSGSMHGTSIAQAKAALDDALGRLRPGDRFNVIRFNNSASSLFPSLVPANGANLGRARHWVARLEASGGTEMAGALRLALERGGETTAGRLRQVLFVTDGAVGNEEALFQLIAARLGDSRLFTVGIGSAPNSHFMRRAAQFGRGSFVHVGDLGQVSARIDTLLRKLDHPALTDVSVTLPDGIAAELFPAPVPDLYLDEPVQLLVASDRPIDTAKVQGQIGSRPWQATLQATAAPAAGIGKLWARRKIATLMDRRTRAADPAAADQLRQAVIEVALAHHLVSSFTSLVAVDVTPARPDSAPLHPQALKSALPHGWSHAKVFGLTKTATPAPLHLLLALLLLLAGWWWWPSRRSA